MGEKEAETVNRLMLLPGIQRYLLFVTMLFFITGMGLLCYCLLFGVDPMSCDVVSSPVHWLVMSCGLYMVFVLHLLRSRGVV